MLYQQRQEITEDGFGKVTAVFRIADTYTNLFSGSPIEVDIFDFGSSKKTADTATGEQKEDEFDFSINSAKINTLEEYNAMVFTLECQASDRWVALFLHEGDTFTLGNVADKEFSGLARRKANARDLLWHGEEWDSNPDPIREWKFSAQSFGTAILDKLNIETETDDLVTTTGLIREAVADTAWLNANLVRPNLWAAYAETYHHGALNINVIFEKLRAIAETRIKTTIPDFALVFKPSNSGHKFMPAVPVQGSGSGEHRFKRYDGDSDLSHTLPFRLFDTTQGRQPYVSKSMLLPAALGEEWDKEHSWLRFANFTDLLYNFALAMGCSLIISETGGAGITVELVPLVGNAGSNVYIKDASTGDIDIQQLSNTDAASVYRADPGSYVVEGAEVIRTDVYSYPYASATATPPLGFDQNKLICVSVAPTLDDHEVRGWDFTAWGYSPWANATGYYTHSALLMYDASGGFVPAYSVICEVGGTAKHYLKLGDCINERLVIGSNKYSTEYSITMPYVSSFSNNADGSAASWKALKLWAGIELDGVSYTITDIERDFARWQTKIKLTNSSKYSFASTLPAVPTHAIKPPSDSGRTYTAGGTIEAGMPLSLIDTGEVYPLELFKGALNTYVGISTNSAAAGGQVGAVTSGFIKLRNFNASTAGAPVYWRAEGASHEPLLTDLETEEIYVRLGQAVDSLGTVELKDYLEYTHRK